MDTSTQPVSTDSALSNLSRQTKRFIIWLIILSVLLVVSVSALSVLFLRRAKAIEQSQKDLAFSIYQTDYAAGNDLVAPKVNTIQFLRRGFSIVFDTVEYKQEGLVLSGRIGNPTQLEINSLAVHFTARPYVYKIKDKWQKEPSWWSDEWNIGTGQTTIGQLNPGTTVPFTVTVPNVKQTSDSIQIAVSFAGEYYRYTK